MSHVFSVPIVLCVCSTSTLFAHVIFIRSDEEADKWVRAIRHFMPDGGVVDDTHADAENSGLILYTYPNSPHGK